MVNPTGGAVRVVIVGAGGLGTPAAIGLLLGYNSEARLSVEIIDDDSIELSNLNRQVLFTGEDLGQNKAITLCNRLLDGPFAANAEKLQFKAQAQRLDLSNIDALLGGADIVLDACDDTATKFLINDYCVLNRIPFCYGGVVALHGQALLVDSRSLPRGGCLRCLFGDYTEADFREQTTSCQANGIVGAVAGFAGFLQADLVLRFLSGKAQTAKGSELVRFSLRRNETRQSFIQASRGCPLGCGEPRIRHLDLANEQCPMTFLYTKLAIEQLSAAELLDVRFSNCTSAESVCTSVAQEKHEIVSFKQLSSSSWRLLIRPGSAVRREAQ